MTANRDNFPAKVRETLAKRVNMHCSKCFDQTNYPHTDDDKSINLGRAAHITAAAQGGPRFDENMTKPQRRAASNGIWLCCNCASEVDSDLSQFTANDLRKMKKNAEDKWRRKSNAPKGIEVVPHVEIRGYRRCSGHHPKYANIVDNTIIGKFYFDCLLRLQNMSQREQVLQKPTLQICKGTTVVFYTDLKSITELKLEPGRVLDKEIHIVLPRPDCNFIDEGDSIFLTFTVLGQDHPFKFKLLDITDEVRQKNAKCESARSNQIGWTHPVEELIRRRMKQTW